MADEYAGEYGHPYPRVDKYGNPVPPMDQYDNPVPREPPATGFGGGTTTYDAAGHVGAAAAYPHEGCGGVGAPAGETTALAYEGMVGGAIGSGMGAAQVQPKRDSEEHTMTTLGEKLRRSGTSSSSSSSLEDDGQGGRRKKSIKEKIKDKRPGSHKRKEQKQQQGGATTGTHAAVGEHEKKGIMDKIKEKLPGHH